MISVSAFIRKATKNCLENFFNKTAGPEEEEKLKKTTQQERKEIILAIEK
jgi:hypothetical protein